MNSRSITDYILKLEKLNEESRTKIEQLKKLYTRAEEEKVNALNELNDLKYKNRSYTETTARVLHKCVNQGLADRMLELGNMTSDYHKTMTYQKAAETISQLDYEVESGESLLQYPGIGKGIAAKINEYLDEQDSDYEESECSDSESIASNDDDSRCAYAPATPDDEGSFVSDTDDEDVNSFSEDEESDDEEFFASFNAGVCDMLHNLADETDDKFKRKAYIRAANSVYELPYKITSGKAISQGPNKVPGIGKSIAAKIDDFLTKTNSVNGVLANCFIKLGNLEEPVYKSEAYWNAGEKIRELTFEVSSGNDVRHLKGFGPSICSKIDEFLETGKIARLEELS
jgi:DNA polymerase/3'-5' exonuclease PolX